MRKPSDKTMVAIEDYLVTHGFSGNIPLNIHTKNWHAIKRLMKRDRFYTFGIKEVHQLVKAKQINAGQIRDILVGLSGLDVKRFERSGAGYFDPTKSAVALVAAIAEIERAAKRGETIIFATGHPGAMTGVMMELSAWATGLGAKGVTIDTAIRIKGRFYLDMIGPIFLPSDDCSAWHSHETAYMDALLEMHNVDLVVSDHGFAGSALNHGLPVVGFYDTDDPALPLAQHLGMPILSVPINDNRYNRNGTQLVKFLLEKLL